MLLIDTHTHLYLPEFNSDRDEMVKRAVGDGVVKLLMPNINLHTVNDMLSAVTRYPGICFPMIGLHPTSVNEDWQSQAETLETLASEHKFIAVGETGIDLYWSRSFLKEQMEAFRKQISFSIKSELPLVIHSRNSMDEVFSVLMEFDGKGLKGVFHAFSGNTDDAKKAIEMGFKLGIGGVVTFKNSGLDKIVEEAGPENILLETDSPYLAPAPHRGKRNESSYLCIINRKVAEILGMSGEEVASVTYANSTKLFNI